MITISLPRVLFCLAVALSLLAPAHAVTPDEILDDPALEDRARELSTQLRCLVCQNQSIDESDAELAKDLRVLVRDRLVQGDTNEEVLSFVVDRYGEFVLLRPQFSGRNALLWATPALVLLLGGISFFAYTRRQARPTPASQLSEDEEKRIADILGDGERRKD
ncbi:MAG: cytochrome c-type biogenesis protein [Pseudomonadota bacterium]